MLCVSCHNRYTCQCCKYQGLIEFFVGDAQKSSKKLLLDCFGRLFVIDLAQRVELLWLALLLMPPSRSFAYFYQTSLRCCKNHCILSTSMQRGGRSHKSIFLNARSFIHIYERRTSDENFLSKKTNAYCLRPNINFIDLGMEIKIVVKSRRNNCLWLVREPVIQMDRERG